MSAATSRVVRTAALVVLAALVIAQVRSALFRQHALVSERKDTYFLPPPDQLVTMSLGYRSALADVLWAHVLVSSGLHNFERRRFDNLTALYDAINALDPKWRSPYLIADSLITFQAAQTPYDEVLKTREILERGVAEHPYDAELWLNLGQFVAFLAPASYLYDTHPEEAERWRMEGAKLLARAAELGAGELTYVSWQAIGAAGIFERAGERDAAIRFLERTRAVTDDPELRRYIDDRLESLIGERELEKRVFVDEAFKKTVLAGLPFAKRATALVLGPVIEPDRCAGVGLDPTVACATSWRQWTERLETSEPQAE